MKLMIKDSHIIISHLPLSEAFPISFYLSLCDEKRQTCMLFDQAYLYNIALEIHEKFFPKMPIHGYHQHIEFIGEIIRWLRKYEITYL